MGQFKFVFVSFVITATYLSKWKEWEKEEGG